MPSETRLDFTSSFLLLTVTSERNSALQITVKYQIEQLNNPSFKVILLEKNSSSFESRKLRLPREETWESVLDF